MVNRLTGTLGVWRNPKQHLNQPSCHYKPLKKPFCEFIWLQPRLPSGATLLWCTLTKEHGEVEKSVSDYLWLVILFFFSRNKFITGLIGYADVDRLLEKQYINAPYVTLFFLIWACRIQNVGADSAPADEFVINVSWRMPESLLDKQKTVALFPE